MSAMRNAEGPRREGPDERRERLRQARLTVRLVAWIVTLAGMIALVLYRRGA